MTKALTLQRFRCIGSKYVLQCYLDRHQKKLHDYPKRYYLANGANHYAKIYFHGVMVAYN